MKIIGPMGRMGVTALAFVIGSALAIGLVLVVGAANALRVWGAVALAIVVIVLWGLHGTAKTGPTGKTGPTAFEAPRAWAHADAPEAGALPEMPRKEHCEKHGKTLFYGHCFDCEREEAARNGVRAEIDRIVELGKAPTTNFTDQDQRKDMR